MVTAWAAALHDKLGMARLLGARGTSPQTASDDDIPLHLATDKCDTKKVERLRSAGRPQPSGPTAS